MTLYYTCMAVNVITSGWQVIHYYYKTGPGWILWALIGIATVMAVILGSRSPSGVPFLGIFIAGTFGTLFMITVVAAVRRQRWRDVIARMIND